MGMSQQVVIPTSTLEQFGKLARLLTQAGKIAHKISQGKAVALNLPTTKLKRPKHVPKDQEWFWMKEWQKGEREVDEALARGDFKEFDNVEDAIKDLHAHV